MSSPEKYLRPEVIQTVARLDLRARFIVEGFLAGLHASPFQGFSVEFSEHRKYAPGDDIRNIDWGVYAKTERYYVKKFEAETNVSGYLVMDLSASMAYTFRQELTKFEYAICLAAASVAPVGLRLANTDKMAARCIRLLRGGRLASMCVLKATRPTGSC